MAHSEPLFERNVASFRASVMIPQKIKGGSEVCNHLWLPNDESMKGESTGASMWLPIFLSSTTGGGPVSPLLC